MHADTVVEIDTIGKMTFGTLTSFSGFGNDCRRNAA